MSKSPYQLPKDKQVARLLTAADLRKAFEFAKEQEDVGYIPTYVLDYMIEHLKLLKEAKD